MKLLPIINELFGGSDSIYDVKLSSKEENSKMWGRDITFYRYYFITKDNIRYEVSIEIYHKSRTGRIDFITKDLNQSGMFISLIDLIHTHDAIKVFNTLKSIIENHKHEIDHLIISSTQDRSIFYKKLLDYLHIKYHPGKVPAEIIADFI
jgi:hypothetical protein